MAFPDITIPPETDHRSLVDKLQRFFNAARKYWLYLSTHTHASGGVGGTVEHGELSGLTDDDHTQYLNVTRHTAISGDHVTNGDSHDHAGGDGAQISYNSLSEQPNFTPIGTILFFDTAAHKNAALLVLPGTWEDV